MDIELKVVTGADLAERLAELREAAHAALVRAVAAAGMDLANTMRANVRDELRQRSGDLARSIVPEPVVDAGDMVSARAGSNLEYAEIQERGGTVHAKNARNLTIPLAAFMTGRGVARGTARGVIDDPGAYGYDGTFFSHGVLFGKRDGAVEPLFALKPSVTIPAHPYAQPALDAVAPRFEAAMRAALEALL